MNETRGAFVVYTNTDLNEGRGHDYPLYVCEKESTARRLAKKRYVQGSDAPVSAISLVKVGSTWYGPVQIIAPTKEDDRNDEVAAKKRAALKKARDAGLTDDDLSDLLRSISE